MERPNEVQELTTLNVGVAPSFQRCLTEDEPKKQKCCSWSVSTDQATNRGLPH